MTENRYLTILLTGDIHDTLTNEFLRGSGIARRLNELNDENEQLKQFIQELTTKGTGRIDLADGYSYSVSAILTNWKGDEE